jgi:hypothetical protein
VHALVANAQLVCDLAQRAAFGVKATNRVLVVDPGTFLLVLEVEQLLAEILGLVEDLLVQRHARLAY